MAKKECEACGAPMVTYRHKLSRNLVRGLYKLHSKAPTIEGINYNELGLTHNEACNFQKLRYWGLIERCQSPEGAKGGHWHITLRGIEFLSNDIALPHRVVTYRASVLEFEDDVMLKVVDVTDGWWFRPDYARESEALEP